MCGSDPESVPHILAGCSALVKTEYIARHNAVLKVLFLELLKDLNLITKIRPWYSPVQPKPMYQNERAKAFWDVAVYAENTEVRANRIELRVIYKQRKSVLAVEMSCQWVDNRVAKDKEKTTKYAALRWELKQQYPGYELKQYNIIIDVLG